ncbi:hypothetical protein H9X57_16885 [Flavobacterium piscinae]|uniref:Uncharacterized protein n=1 Tax=Flavobacterium piscinae TaxID=2506424 RepID=A0A4Q1KML0_9FLAO|nr:hypothetical protein [Flavobacterium piscinae]MBC8884440.1 hypothetical protein [Flavobacterium piscinae]RXR30670.1 hypothetical protein EQG68_11470 [Flavobacterium piscinae]
MKDTFYTVSLTIAFSLLLLFMYYRVSNLEHKYETLKEANVRLKSNLPLTDAQIKERQFKEEMYIRQQEKDTTLILSVIGFSLVFAGFLSFKLFDDRVKIINTSFESSIHTVNSRIDAFIETINSITTNYETNYKNIEHTIYDLKNDFDYELVTLKQNEAKQALSNQNLNGYIFYSLYSYRFSAKCILYYRRIGSNLSENLLAFMNNSIESFRLDLISILSFDNTEKILLSVKDKETIVNLIKEINKVGDTKTFDKLNLVYSLLEFKD